MTKLSDLRADVGLEREGVWKKWTLDIEIKVGCAHTPEYRKTLREAVEPFLLNGSQDLTDAQELECENRALARHCFLDWKGIEDDGLQERTEDKAFEILQDPAYHRLRTWLVGQANASANFRAQTQEKHAQD